MSIRIVAGESTALLCEIGLKSLANSPVWHFQIEARKAFGISAFVPPQRFLERGDALPDSGVSNTEQAGNFAPGMTGKCQSCDDAQ